MQNLCDEIFTFGGLLACYVVDSNARVMGMNTGEMDLGEDLEKSFGAITGVIWGGLKKVEPLGGPISLVSADFEYFRIVGVPIPNASFSVLLVASLETDPHGLKARVLAFVKHWLESNPDTKR